MRLGVVRRIAASGILALASGAFASTSAEAGAVTFTMDAPALLSLLRAYTPYDVVVGKKGLSETLTLSNPRDLRFEEGRIRVKIDCRGTPLPLEEVLEPALSIRWDEARKAFQARIEDLPLKVPVIGTVDLAEYLRPITIPSVFQQSAGEGDQILGIDGKITSLRVLDTMIQVSADVSFRRPAPPPSAAARPPAASGR